MSADEVASNFGAYVKYLENEVKTLKCLSNLRAISSSSQSIALLNKLEGSVTSVEENLDFLDAWIEEETRSLDQFEEMIALCKNQSDAVSGVVSTLSEDTNSGLISGGPVPAVVAAPASVPMGKINGSGDAAALDSGTRAESVSVKDFNSISRSIRGKATVEELNSFYASLQELKAKATKGFIAEKDLRSCPGTEAEQKRLLQVLQELKKIKLSRTTSGLRYTLL